MDLVIAVYKEPIHWIQSLSVDRIFIYLKDPSRYTEIRNLFPNSNVEVLANVGRESHTYLHHIRTHYNTIGNHTLFLQGNPFDHCSIERIHELLKTPTDSFSALGDIKHCNSTGYPDHPELPVSRIYRTYIGKDRNTFEFAAGAQFMVSRDRIHSIPLDMYEKLYTAHYIEPLLPWCIERYWQYIYLSQ